MKHKILMIDDEEQNLTALRGFLDSNGLMTIAESSTDAALGLLDDNEFSLVLLDYRLGNETGCEVAKRILEKNPEQQIIMLSADSSREALLKSVRAGALDFLEKLTPPTELLGKVMERCRRYESVYKAVKIERCASDYEKAIAEVGMVGRSESMFKVSQQIKQFAAAKDSSVHIYGETGTGKELVARALHDLSARAKYPFVAINCGAIVKDLIESELFGHQKGSFTGAIADRDGKFAQANGGTIFLDEIGDMPPEAQVKLLRVLQEKKITPVGSKIEKKVDIRIITATHRNIERLVEEGEFRLDLLHRIKVLDIQLPALRDRLDDLEPLVAHFTNEVNKKQEFRKYFRKSVLEVMRTLPWTGNIRELAGYVESHLVRASATYVEPEDLDSKSHDDSDLADTPLLEKFDRVQCKTRMEFIQHTINNSRTKAEAARRLGITPSNLQYMLKWACRSTEKSLADSVGRYTDIKSAARIRLI